MHLLDLLFPPRDDERAIRDVTTDSFLEKLVPYQVAETRPAALALLPFGDPVVRAVIHEAKYHGSAHAFALLGAALADFLPSHLADSLDNVGHVGHRVSHIVVPVPLGAARRKERGYNQVEEVARRALPSLSDTGVVITLDTELLARTRETPTQISLKRAAREKNMAGAFAATCAPDLAARYVILDDVLTTGATLGAALEALVASGIPREHLLPLALAYQS